VILGSAGSDAVGLVAAGTGSGEAAVAAAEVEARGEEDAGGGGEAASGLGLLLEAGSSECAASAAADQGLPRVARRVTVCYFTHETRV